jgi:SAM-dependent methyltransferase
MLNAEVNSIHHSDFSVLHSTTDNLQMPMTQDAIRAHYEGEWKHKSDSAEKLEQISYSNPVEDAVMYPIYRQMIADHKVRATGDVLDIGSGSGRWIRFFLENFKPQRLQGVDYTQASVDLLRRWFAAGETERTTKLAFDRADITEPNLDLGWRFDLINIANVLFHIPEQDKFQRALENLARHLRPDGVIATTEYMPRVSMRTEWMLVRDRYFFEHAVKQAGLRIVAVKAFGIFANDPMGLDGPDHGTRGQFQQVRGLMQTLQNSIRGQDGEAFLVRMFSQIETAVLSFCRERIADVDMPSQKLVFLAPAR